DLLAARRLGLEVEIFCFGKAALLQDTREGAAVELTKRAGKAGILAQHLAQAIVGHADAHLAAELIDRRFRGEAGEGALRDVHRQGFLRAWNLPDLLADAIEIGI